MRYALNLGEDGRILSSTFDNLAPAKQPRVDELPNGGKKITEYKYINGNFVYDPIPVEPVEEEPTQLDRIEAQVTYTAMMTDTLLEV